MKAIHIPLTGILGLVSQYSYPNLPHSVAYFRRPILRMSQLSVPNSLLGTTGPRIVAEPSQTQSRDPSVRLLKWRLPGHC